MDTSRSSPRSAGAAPVLVAPDSFKGTIHAREVADAIGRGLKRAGVVPDLCPLADGGEGTADVLRAALGGRVTYAPAHDPLGRPLEAPVTHLDDGRTAIIEVASASGLPLLSRADLDAEAASTYGTGELIATAVDAGAQHIVVAAGGSATTDGGAGALAALAARGGLRGARLSVLCDVRTPWEQAPAAFGPQKGADASALARLGRRLHALADGLPRDPRGVPMTGAAGGLAGGLWAAHNAALLPGARHVMNAVGFDQRLSRSRAVITGEGRLDDQSACGKVVGEVVRRGERSGTAVFAIVGISAVDDVGADALRLHTIVEAGSLDAIQDAAAFLARCA